jgi:hypothetical protein
MGDVAMRLIAKRRRRKVCSLAAAGILVATSCSSNSTSSDSTTKAVPDDELVFESKVMSLFADTTLMSSPDQGQEAIAGCMVKRGWEYTPIKIDIPTDASMLSPTAESNRLFDAEFRTAFGYGVATAYGDDGRIKEGAPGYEFSQIQPQEDPNSDYVSSLSDAERSRYFVDLFGSDPSVGLGLPGTDGTAGTDASAGNTATVGTDPNGSDGGSDLDTDASDLGGSTGGTDLDTGVSDAFEGSCSASAIGPTGNFDRLSELLTTLGDALTKAGVEDEAALVKKSPELREAQVSWSECMAKSSHDFESVQEPRQQIQEEFEELGGGGALPTDPGLVMPDGAGEAPADESNPNPVVVTAASGDSEDRDLSSIVDDLGILGGGFDPDSIDLDKLHDLQKRELKVAADDYACQRSTYRPVFVKMMAEAEQKFMDDNASVIAELRKLLSASDAAGG